MKTITGCSGKSGVVSEGPHKAEELNLFFNQFNSSSAISTPPLPPSGPSGCASSSSSGSSPPVITAYQVWSELCQLHPRKAAGPDGVCPRLLKACADELCEPLQHVFNLSLQLGRVPSLWKTSCIVPVPKKTHPCELNDYRPVTLTSHAMKTLERLVMRHLRRQVQNVGDPLQFAYREKPSLLQEKLNIMAVDPHLVNWIMDYLTNRPQYVRVGGQMSSTLTCSTGAPQGTVLSPLLFTLYTSDYNSNTCHIQKFSNDTAIVTCIRDGEEEEYRSLVQKFEGWCQQNLLLLNISKTKEMVLDFRRAPPSSCPIIIQNAEVEVVSSYKYLGLQMDDKLNSSKNMECVYKKGQSRMYFLRRLASFKVCSVLLNMFYQSIVSSVLFYAVVCWGGSARKRDTQKLNRIIRRVGSVVGLGLDSVEKVVEQRTF
ncbi:hypothetical protein WMY93_026979 [Mugilogobius chulae]|uniref:Reverse transcriptase domain-containing protein n=1 Tax=Mugilogobius chulae TaxID=88201 RepID=A0AAW0MUZ4_9GOBI